MLDGDEGDEGAGVGAAATVNERETLTDVPFTAAVTSTLKVPLTVGVPVISPVDVFNERPVGNAPLDSVNVAPDSEPIVAKGERETVEVPAVTGTV